MEKVVIVGGGVAGLSCLNALLDRGIDAFLIEGGQIGSSKMCGEYIAPAATRVLQSWNIGPLQTINQAIFSVGNKEFRVDLPTPASAMARSDVELLLAQRAKKHGGRIQEKAPIKHISQKNKIHELTLHDGTVIAAQSAIFATGKFSGDTQKISPPYVAFKFHLQHIPKPATLIMLSLPDAYMGLVPIDDTHSNCVCLARREVIDTAGSATNYFVHLLANNQKLQELVPIHLPRENFFAISVSEFALKNNPDWENTLWIGDALGSIYPAIGYGFANSVTTGVMAADYFQHGNTQAYLSQAKQFIKPKLRIAKLMHNLLLRPTLGNITVPLLKAQPWIVSWLFKQLDY